MISFCDNGDGVEQDYAKAVEFYTKAAAQGDASAQNNLGIMYENGQGVEQDYDKAVELYTKAAEQGYAYARYNLGIMYDNGRGVEQDYSQAIEFYSKAAEQELAAAQYNLGYMHANGRGVEQDYTKAVEFYTKAAEQGHDVAQYNLGNMYYNGQGVEQDYAKAFEWWQKAAEQGYTAAQYNLGVMYDNGQGVEQDYTKAVEFYTKAAEQGHAKAQYNLGTMYAKGRGVEQDYSKAVEFYTKAAEQGHAKAQYNLGNKYYNGQGVEQDYAKAVEFYTKAAAQGVAYAQNILGTMYAKGRGVEKNIEKATDYYKQACTGEDISEEAAYRLGYIYYDGEGVRQDLQEALKYFKLAFENGYECSYAVDMVESELLGNQSSSKRKKNKKSVTYQYANEIISKNPNLRTVYKQVGKDLKNDFGDTWDKLQENSQKFLFTSMVSYISFKSLGAQAGNLDFTSSITPMIKALEIECAKYLYSDYIKYLIENKVPIDRFSSERIFIVRNGTYSFGYASPENVDNFTLGSLQKVIGIDKKTQELKGFVEISGKDSKADASFEKAISSIDEPMLEYLKSIFKEDAFGSVNVDRAITDYIISFAREIMTIIDTLRNPAAHSDMMSCYKAEACSDYLIKKKKIICKFLEKLK